MTLRPIRLPPGADLRNAVEAIAAGLQNQSGFVVAGIGSLVHARLRMAGATDTHRVPGPLEIISVTGSISADGAHLHMAVSNAAGEVVGGHVCAGCEIRTTAELLVTEVSGHTLSREFDAVTGFKELAVHTVGAVPVPYRP